MEQLRQLIGNSGGWKIIGSSLGGLMATWFALESSHQVDRLILLAPALPWLPRERIATIYVATIVYHGKHDDTVPLENTRQIAQQVFANLVFHEVNDNHGLGRTVQIIDWPALLKS
jgi:predicted esterase